MKSEPRLTKARLAYFTDGVRTRELLLLLLWNPVKKAYLLIRNLMFNGSIYYVLHLHIGLLRFYFVRQLFKYCMGAG